ncbi:hypothetical protein TL16_g05523 [Triparma laevis f. inornata]|uniref:Nudix hydrolase domain-containing protein n=1 Tax=Triparma laevis f. inornata TaxID=1714386 RepID=A0A9W7AHY3_9STRA|nr:hypothetical protein TL16_g05523 [Triparma laevis f. inornata]
MVIFKGEKSLAVSRKNRPIGLALVGGFVDVGETCLEAAIREIQEETYLNLEFYSFNLLPKLYDNPKRDERRHTVSAVYWVEIDDSLPSPVAGDDAKDLIWVERGQKLVFDHTDILERAWEEREKYREKVYERYNPDI